MKTVRRITCKDELILQLLQDPLWRVTAKGRVMTKVRGNGIGGWRRAGWISPSRNGTKLYRRVQYRGEGLYEHRIVFAALKGSLSPFKTINHKNLNGLNNHPGNLELITAGENVQHAKEYYRRRGLSAAEAKANWIRGKHQGGSSATSDTNG